MKLLKILILCLTLSATVPISSCNVKLVPEKNAAMYLEVQDVVDDAVALYNRIMTSNDKRFVTYEEDYNSVISKARSVLEKDKLRNKAGKHMEQDIMIIGVLEDYKKKHSEKSVLANSEAKVLREYIRSIIRPRLVSELSL